ncbi:Acetokinase family-domain-containing protein [Dipodascopsis uninucleata]
MKAILCLNAGSSSVKFSLYEHDAKPRLVISGAVSGLTAEKQFLDYKSFSANGDIIETIKRKEVVCKNHDDAFALFLQHLHSKKGENRIIHSLDEITVACHRIVHGGTISEPLIITPDVYHELDILSDLAPLHNERALDIVHSCIDRLKSTRNVAFFDSSFHTTLAPHIYTYPIDLEVQRSRSMRKYGFHGLSYAYITKAAAGFLNVKKDDLNIIALHLGSGASACVIMNGKSVNTSMGLTPLEGLPGATRSGSIDPSLIFHYQSDSSRMSTALSKELRLTVAEDILNKQAGWQSLTGTTDFGLITKRAFEEHDVNAKLAFDIFVDRVSMYVGSYFVAAKGKLDALVFAGGIGEKGSALRKAVIDQVECLGFNIDEQLNEEASKATDSVFEISEPGSKLKSLVVKTDEQLQMALEASSFL